MGLEASAAVELDPQHIAALVARERELLDRRTPRSGEMFRRARRVLPGGVASSFHARRPWPIYVERGEGPRVWDLDGNEYVDLHNGFSAMVQGHAHPAIGAALANRYGRGTHFAATTEDGVIVAEELARRFGLPLWRFTNSGSESTMAAVRVARAHTGRDGVLKISGSYNGHHDTAMVGVHDAGVPQAVAEDVHSVHFNDPGGMERQIADLAPACVLMEPVMTNVGLVPPEPGYLAGVREITRRYGVVLIFDEVKTGLTIAPGGATERFKVEPDMVALAKALGGGLPSGAVGMNSELAAGVEDGRVPVFGTYNGNPLGMAAARASLLEILTPEAYERLERLGGRLAASCEALIAGRRLAAGVTGLGSKGSVSYGAEPVVDYASFERRYDPQLAELVWTYAMNRGVYTTPGREQEWNLSVAHGEAELDRYLEVYGELADELT
jgi:glutamate-1-semialdehyde 2,1-aminomutase